MRTYFDANEQVADGIVPDFIRLDITDKSQAVQDAILTKMKAHPAGQTFVFTKHTHLHEEGLSCTSEVV